MIKTRKLLYVLLTLVLISACGRRDPQAVAATSTDPERDEPMLLGEGNLDQLKVEPYSAWFVLNPEEYPIKEEVVQQLGPLLEDVEITLFLGTWCKDSRREVPPFLEMLAKHDYPIETIDIYYMDREKTTPEQAEAGLEITNIPTIIFKRGGQEINRIVEIPVRSLEADMLTILSGEPYQHAYDWD